MEKYLLQILESNNRVIIPEFGAFIIKQRNPLTIIFNEFLQYNDGILVDMVSKTEGIDRDAAKKKIDDFTAGLVSELEKTGQYPLKGIGVVMKGASGKISLEKEETKKASIKESKPTGTTVKKPVQVKEEKAAVASKKLEDKLDETIEIDSEKPKPIETKKEEPKKEEPKKEEPKPPEKTEEPKQPVLEKKPSEVKKEIPKTEESKAVSKPEIRPPVAKTEEKQEVRASSYTDSSSYSSDYETSKRGRTNLIIWLIVIVIINGALIGYFVYSEEISALFSKKLVDQTETFQEEQLVPETESSAPAEQTMPQEKIEEEPAVAAETPITPIKSGPRFYIVAGAFREEINADNLVKELRQKGYNAEKFGKIGNLHAVSYGVYKTKAEADAELRKIHNGVDAEAWIKEVN